MQVLNWLMALHFPCVTYRTSFIGLTSISQKPSLVNGEKNREIKLILEQNINIDDFKKEYNF